MAEVKWIKITTDIFNDEKILLVESMPEADAIIVIWFKLLCLAGKCNNNGVFILNRMPFTDEMFSAIFRRPLQTVRLALQTFEQLGMIEVVERTITIPNWEKHQNIQGLTKIQEQTRRRVSRYRERQRMLAENCNANSNVTVTQSNATEEELDKELDIDNKTTTVVDVFNRNIHPITPFEFEKLNDWLKDLPGEVVIEAINEAVSANVRKWSYINGILTNWQNDGVTTIDAVNARRRERSDKNDRTTNNARKNNGKSEIDWSKFEFQSKD